MFRIRKIECEDFAYQDLPPHVFLISHNKKIIDTALTWDRAVKLLDNYAADEQWKQFSKHSGPQYPGQSEDSVYHTSCFNSGFTG